MSCSRPRRVARPEELDSDVPPGLGLMLYGYPRIPLRSILGYFPSFPTGTLWSLVLWSPMNRSKSIRAALRDAGRNVAGSPGFTRGYSRLAPPGRILVFPAPKTWSWMGHTGSFRSMLLKSRSFDSPSLCSGSLRMTGFWGRGRKARRSRSFDSLRCAAFAQDDG
jgi:hypothetical protein